MKNKALTVLEPDTVSETVSFTNVPRYEERSSISYVDFVTMKRFNIGVNMCPTLTPVAYRDTVVCYVNSSKKRFKSTTLYEPKIRPRKFSDTLVVFPKRPQKSFVTCLDYHIDECRRWFKTTMEFKAKTYTTSKIVRHSDGESDEEARSDTCTEGSSSGEENYDAFPACADGHSVSQVLIPRWNRDGLPNGTPRLPIVNGDIVINGY